ncbi:ATP-dependent DNA helicase PcrA [Candidatus Parcubacteria bacterium]|nr:MAG: ATP-dependent DNA helicase PcrA [Candidatus Parcubacteria bacterium]
MPTNFLDGLNERQREAAAHGDGPLLIVAGAGAGKTKTITHRIARLIGEGVPAREILAVTFTNKAAGEMRERVRNLVPASQGTPLVVTFHALGVRLLREFHAEAGLPRAFTIWDRNDSLRAVKKALEQLDIDQPARGFLGAISNKKGDGISKEEFASNTKSHRDRLVAQVWEIYEGSLHEEGALDFDDLLLRTLKLLRDNTRLRSLLQNRWRYITIDEYQDTNASQYEIARLLAGDARNICVVGDTDQNIYSWRGANLGHLLEFETDFPGAKVVLLEQNYRSTRTILSAANSVIEKNRRRKPKKLYTDKATGEPIVIYEAGNEIDEAWFVANMSRQLIEDGTVPREIAILYRENFQSRALEEAMLHMDVPYRVLGTRFFQRKEVKDVLSYLRAAINPKNKADITRIIAVPARGIGKVTLDKMLAGQDAALPAAAKAKVSAFRMCLAKIKQGIEILPASEAVALAIEVSGMQEMYKGSDEGRERLENMSELVNFAARFDNDAPPSGIEKLLEEAALQSDQDQLEEAHNAVSLMTVHASKGLEFDVVFITGLEQGLFPAMRMNESADRDPEEERRLFYVALTRARERLYLVHAQGRMKYGSREYAIPSEFLDDIDARLVQRVQKKRSLIDDEDVIR